MTHEIIINPWNVCLWQIYLFIYLFIYLCSLHVFTKNGMIRKISKTVHV